MTRYMITNRNRIEKENSFGDKRTALSYWVQDKNTGWQRVTKRELLHRVRKNIADFPIVSVEENHAQKHVMLFVHGYANTWLDAVDSYNAVSTELAESVGIGILFNWASDGNVGRYISDREDALASSSDLSTILREIQKLSEGFGTGCKAKVSIIAHSMGCYVVQKALAKLWDKLGRPLTMSVITQLILLAADIDNDIFKCGETVDGSDGDAMANLCYRITALYTGLDEVLGMSAGLKHFGKRRLGRSGLDKNYPLPDNVWETDVTPLFGGNIYKVHSSYFSNILVMRFVGLLLMGRDRKVVMEDFVEIQRKTV